MTARVTALNETPPPPTYTGKKIFKQFPSKEPSRNDAGCNYLEKPHARVEAFNQQHGNEMVVVGGLRKFARAFFIESASFLCFPKNDFRSTGEGVFDTCGVVD